MSVERRTYGRKEMNKVGDSRECHASRRPIHVPYDPSPLQKVSSCFFFTDTQGISQTQAFKTDFQKQTWRCQRIDSTGIINHLGKQNLSLRDGYWQGREFSYGKLLDTGVKHPYRLWQENKSCHQEQLQVKKVKEKQKRGARNAEWSLRWEGDPWSGPDAQPRKGDTPGTLKVAMVTWLKTKWWADLRRAITEASSQNSVFIWQSGHSNLGRLLAE